MRRQHLHRDGALEAKRDVSRASFAGATANIARQLGFTERKPDVAELMASQTKAAGLAAIDPAARHAAIEQAL